jgi:phage terminase large subunit-like protein
MIARQANNPAQKPSTRPPHLWVTGNASVLHGAFRLAKRSVDIGQYEGRPCILALDIANKIDLASAVVIFGMSVTRRDRLYRLR